MKVSKTIKMWCRRYVRLLFETVVNRLLNQAAAWQLISVNVNHQSSADISVIVEELLTLVRAHLPVIFSYRETDPGMCPRLEFTGWCLLW